MGPPAQLCVLETSRRDELLLNVEDFLHQLQVDSGLPRHTFSLDLARAQELLQLHAGVQAQDYPLHLVQWGWLQGARQLQLRIGPGWLEWQLQGGQPDVERLWAVSQGEVRLADGDLSALYLLHSLALMAARGPGLECGNLLLRYQRGAWHGSRRPQFGPIKLRLKLPLAAWARGRLLGGWHTFPEVQALLPRLSGSPLAWQPPSPIRNSDPPLDWILQVQGQAAIGIEPPLPTSQVRRIERNEWTASMWFSPQGQRFEVISQGLSYALEPILPGSIWLALGDLPTDLSRRQLIQDEAFRQRIDGWLEGWVGLIDSWTGPPLGPWLRQCLTRLGNLPPALVGLLLRVPLIPTLFHGDISLRLLDSTVAEIGVCYVSDEPPFELSPEFRAPIIVYLDPGAAFLPDWLRRRYRHCEEAAELLRRCQLRSLRLPLHQRPMTSPYQRWIELQGWQGRVGFDPQGGEGRLELGRNGQLVGVVEVAGMPRGFHLLVEHPELDWDPYLERPQGPLIEGLRKLVNEQLLGWAAEACLEHRPELLEPVILELLKLPDLSLEPVLELALWPNGLTLARLIADARAGDLRDWVDIGVEIQGGLVLVLSRHLERDPLERLLETMRRYEAAWRQWLQQPTFGNPHWEPNNRENLQLQFGSSTPTIHFYRHHRLLHQRPLAGAQAALGLEVWAEHDGFRLLPDASDIDPACSGMVWFRQAFQALVTRELEPFLEGADELVRIDALAAFPASIWPRQVPWTTTLAGEPVTLGQLADLCEGETVQPVLVQPAARRPLPGYERAWLLSTPQFQRFQQQFPRLQLFPVTAAYHKAYAASRDRHGEAPTEQLPQVLGWSHRRSLKLGSLEAIAGLESEPGDIAECLTVFARNDRKVMQASLRLGRKTGSPLPYRLCCLVNWPELPFCDHYLQFVGLPEVQALLRWLRCYGVEAGGPLDYAFHRLELEHHQLSTLNWSGHPDGVREVLWTTPFLCNAGGRAFSLDELNQQGECAYTLEGRASHESTFVLTEAQLARLQAWLPNLLWRHESQPDARQRALDRMLAWPPVELALPPGDYLVQGQDGPGGCLWGILPPGPQASSLNLFYQGRFAAQKQISWPFTARVALSLDELPLTPRGELPEGWLPPQLSAIETWLQSKICQPPADRLYSLSLLQFSPVPAWAQALLEQPHLAQLAGGRCSPLQWLHAGPRPRPCLDPNLTLPEGFDATGWVWLDSDQRRVVSELKLGCDFSEDLLEIEQVLQEAPPFEPPACEVEFSGQDFRLFSWRSCHPCAVSTTLNGRVLECLQYPYFPPYHLELQVSRQLPLPAPEFPSQAFEQLADWWRQQLQLPLEEMHWLVAFEDALEQAEPWEGGEDILWAARRRLQEWYTRQLRPWELLEQCLERYLSVPWKLRLADSGPAFQLERSGSTLTLHIVPEHPLLAHHSQPARVAYWLACLHFELPGGPDISQILLEFNAG